MTTKHTPGPWRVNPGANEVRGADWNFIVADVLADADANLIAAAPDLLAACESAVNMCPRDCTPGWYCGVCGVLFAAIAKAKGEKP